MFICSVDQRRELNHLGNTAIDDEDGDTISISWV